MYKTFMRYFIITGPFIFLLCLWLVLDNYGYVYELKISNGVASRLNLLPLFLACGIVIALVGIKKSNIIFRCVLAVLAGVLLSFSLDEKLHEEFDISNLRAGEPVQIIEKNIADNVKVKQESYTRSIDQMDDVPEGEENAYLHFKNVNEGLDLWSSDSMTSVPELIAVNVKIELARRIAAYDWDNENRSRVVKLLQNIYSSTENYTKIHPAIFALDYALIFVGTAGIMTNRRANAVYENYQFNRNYDEEDQDGLFMKAEILVINHIKSARKELKDVVDSYIKIEE